MTGKVVWHMTMSLDGFIADRDDGLDWAFGHSAPTAEAAEVIRTTGAFMAGGRNLDAFGDERTKPYGGAWTGPIFVLTHRDPGTTPDPSITLLSGDITDAVDVALKAADGKNLVVTGGSVPRQCVARGLVDEIVVHLVPVLLGDGVRFFDSPGGPPAKLELIRSEAEQVIDLRYRVVK
ncbi:dihydrofolate reductase family protein [Amycolatopsis sp. NPDC059021]|uniref:dihydrofolate reductase family protein n=1 Tax=Amycolatopsis sp. NPDC059021 TaxID=3346704 RepID=UPI00366C25B1